MSTPHVIASSSSHPPSSTTSNGIVGNHYRVGKKIGEGSFGVVFEGHTSSWSFFCPYHSGCAATCPQMSEQSTEGYRPMFTQRRVANHAAGWSKIMDTVTTSTSG
ncbi:hypothetical protein B0H12DRAFT_131142 [Mycena haematopus]|nr:hypothetical protein B0H12DRAFT_131142 [Mycena haematopus]